MATDHAPHQALMRQVVQPAVLAVSLPGGVEQGQVARMIRLQEPLLQGGSERLGMRRPHKPPYGQGSSIADQSDRFGGVARNALRTRWHGS
jgi:hypothetical protein